MPKHKYADLMLQYAQDAQETETPWERWQVKTDDFWRDCNIGPTWLLDAEYRRKPKVIIINGIEVPEPMQVAPPVGTNYFYITIADFAIVCPTRWSNRDFDKRLLSRGLGHLTEDAAVKHVEALLSFTQVQE